MKKAAVFLANGFEEIEAIGIVDYLRRSNIEVTTVSIKDEKVKSARNITIIADALFDETEMSVYDAIILPGGLQGAESLRDDKEVIKTIRDFFDEGKLVAAICAGPIALYKAGILEGKNFTIYPTMKDEIKNGIYSDLRAVCDGNIITGSGPGSVFAFSHAITSYLAGVDIADETARGMLLA